MSPEAVTVAVVVAVVALFLVVGYFAVITRLNSLLAHLTAAVVGYAAFYFAGVWLLGTLS